MIAYLEQRFIGGRGCWYLNGVELLLEFGPVVVYVRHCDHDAGRRGERRPSVVPDRHLKTKIKFLRIGWKLIFCHCENFLTVFIDTFEILTLDLTLEIYRSREGSRRIFIRKFLHEKNAMTGAVIFVKINKPIFSS